jgi:hypothetical protein
MAQIDFTKSTARDAVTGDVSPNRVDITLGKGGGGISLEGVAGTGARFITGFITVHEDHSVAMMFRFFTGPEKERLYIRFGLLPRLRTRVCFDLNWLDNSSIFTNRTPGTLKLVIHGLRTSITDVVRAELGVADSFHDIHVTYEDFCLTDEEPKDYPLPDVKLVDEFGQWKPKEWPGKVHSLEELRSVMKEQEGPAQYPCAEWNRWGGDTTRKLKAGTGFFSTVKTADGRWHLVDPDGCDYVSVGPCCIHPGEMGRVDSFEKLCDGLPSEKDPAYGQFYQSGVRRRNEYMPLYSYKLFNFQAANMYKIYGDQWKAKWEEISYHTLVSHGINSQGNFGSFRLGTEGTEKIPYVREIPGFPVTETLIFRDFPDVLSPEYERNAEKYAATLESWKDDPWLIGYFLRNEPEYNFVPDLKIADEVFHNPQGTCCKAGLIEFLRNRYSTVEKLNKAWDSNFTAFSGLERPIACCSVDYPASLPDILEYSKFLIGEYIRIPAKACRAVDRNHLNLGLRWSKADNLLMMSGWEHFDVFSINCYSFDPTADMDFVKNAGVDLPILIGEFHCGALDRGLPATGLKGVENQHERGVMWRSFVERCIAHPCGVGAHWFQYNDQFCLGRPDGENYQIGMMDVCMRPHKELFDMARETARVLYRVKNGEVPPCDTLPKGIPMIGY